MKDLIIEEQMFRDKELEAIEPKDKCVQCSGRLFVNKSKILGKCVRCRKEDIKVPFNGHTQYPGFESLSEANSYFGI